MTNSANRETEIKLSLNDPARIRRWLRQHGYRVTTRRQLESNLLLDTPGRELLQRRQLLRLRTYAGEVVLTFKGAPTVGRHKSRPEFEVSVSDLSTGLRILKEIGYTPCFRYEKFRTIYRRPGSSGLVALDETPIGDFLELEGQPAWIDRTASTMGYTVGDYITASYARLYFDWRRQHQRRAGNMSFRRRPSGTRSGALGP